MYYQLMGQLNFSRHSVDDFIKSLVLFLIQRKALEPVYKDIVKFADAEGLTAHANSLTVLI